MTDNPQPITGSTTDAPGVHLADPIDRPDSPVQWLVRLLKGVLVGVGAILPGLSGGVLAVIFGIYEPAIRFLANLRDRFWRHVLYFLPIVIGAGLGIVAFSALVEAAFGKYQAMFICLFIGFVAGTFPALYRQAGKRGRRRGHLAIMWGAAAALFALMLIGGNTLVDVAATILAWFASGALIGLGLIVPGLSPSNFLIYFGLYDTMATGIKNVDFSVIVPLALAKVANWAFDRYHGAMYHFIVGTVIGSSVAIVPTVVVPGFSDAALAEAGLGPVGAVWFAVGLFVVGVAASYLFSRVEEKVDVERAALDGAARDSSALDGAALRTQDPGEVDR